MLCEDSILLSRPLLAPRGTIGDEATRGQRNEEEREEKTQLGEAVIHSTEGHWKEQKNCELNCEMGAKNSCNVFVPWLFPIKAPDEIQFSKAPCCL